MNDQPLAFSKPLTVTPTTIPGMLLLDLPVHGDARGWFKENWQRTKMIELGLPDFHPVQNNISFNAEKGVTRGIHAEPWDKYISIGSGRIFGAWVDLREGDSFGTVFTAELDPTKAIFVPRGVGNAFQALDGNTVYTYLVNDHWSAEAQAQYTFLNLADPTANIAWPIPLDVASLSDKDKQHPVLSDVTPMKPKKVLITGANGQLGRALRVDFPDAEFTTRDDLDITSTSLMSARPWRHYSAIINAAAYTAVDTAETPDGRASAWQINAAAVANLARVATAFNITLVHISSDYVFDGKTTEHSEDEPLTPLGVYGQTKAAGDVAAAAAANYFVLRTSWVIGDGANFVRTMQTLASKDIHPSVINDQIGRLTFTGDLSRAISHLLSTGSPFGTYNVTGDGAPASWADIAQLVYTRAGRASSDVTPVSTEAYYRGKTGIAARPLQSTLNLDKIKATGFMPSDWRQSLEQYLNN